MTECDGISCCQVGFQIWPATCSEIDRLMLKVSLLDIRVKLQEHVFLV